MRRVFGFVAISFLASSAVLAQDASIRVGGSTTALPIISQCAAHFMEKVATWDKADPALGKEQTVVYVTGGGSGFGVKGLMNGTIDVGMVSRDLKESEIKDAGRAGHAGVRARRRGDRDQHRQAPSRRASRDLPRPSWSGIFSGQMAQFSQIDGSLPAKPVVLLTRDASGGVTEIFQERVMKKERLAASRLQFPSTAALIRKLETSDAAIAFVSAGAVSQDSQLRTYAVDGVAAVAGEHRQRQVQPESPDAGRGEAESVAQGAALHGLRAGRLPGHREGDGLRAGARGQVTGLRRSRQLADTLLRGGSLVALAGCGGGAGAGRRLHRVGIPHSAAPTGISLSRLPAVRPLGSERPARRCSASVTPGWRRSSSSGWRCSLATPLALADRHLSLAKWRHPPCARSRSPRCSCLPGVPAVVYGFVGYATLVPLMARWLPTGETLLCAARDPGADGAAVHRRDGRGVLRAGRERAAARRPRAGREPLVHVHAHHAAQGRRPACWPVSSSAWAAAWARRSPC